LSLNFQTARRSLCPASPKASRTPSRQVGNKRTHMPRGGSGSDGSSVILNIDDEDHH